MSDKTAHTGTPMAEIAPERRQSQNILQFSTDHYDRQRYAHNNNRRWYIASMHSKATARGRHSKTHLQHEQSQDCYAQVMKNTGRIFVAFGVLCKQDSEKRSSSMHTVQLSRYSEDR